MPVEQPYEIIPALDVTASAEAPQASEHKPASGVRYIDSYQSGPKIHTRAVRGYYQRLRRYLAAPLLLAYVALPWLSFDGRPLMLFDLERQQFHILGATFWPQDGIFLAGLLIIAAFLLFLATVWVGRVWCGFTCPQTVWTQMFVWAEHLCEGDRNQRIKLDAQRWGWNRAAWHKLLRRGATHSIWWLISLVTGLTFIAYFYGAQALLLDLWQFNASLETWFWLLFFAGFTYMNAGFLREQVCKHMCPYARFQSAMYDAQTLLVSYDAARGDGSRGAVGRGARKTGEDYRAKGLGDCIDCSWCVQVCPVDIDIRDGLQYECIDCGLCADACDSVMDKLGYARGLIRFTSEDALAGKPSSLWRPRLAGYLLAALLMLVAFAYLLADRNPLTVDVVRDRGAHLYQLRGGQLENVYTVKINNMSRARQVFQLSLEGQHDYRLKGLKRVVLEEGEVLSVPIRVSLPAERLKSSRDQLRVRVTSQQDKALTATQVISFIGPGLERR